MHLWKVEIEVWPFFTGRGHTVDQMQAGNRLEIFEVKADNIQEALHLSRAVCVGIKRNPIVWQTQIKSITQIGHADSKNNLVSPVKEKGKVYTE